MDGWEQIRYLIGGLFTVCVAFYWMSAAFRFHIKVVAYHIYFLVAAVGVIPFMIVRGRSRKNIAWCKRAMRLAGFLFGLHSEIIDEKNLILDGPSVVVVNHQSELDLVGLQKVFSLRSTVLAKKFLLYAGPFGLGTWLSGFIFIERTNQRQSREQMDKVADEINREGLSVVIFPEGTRNMKEEMLPFKKGAFNLAVKAQVPIVPVVFSSYKKFFYPKQHIFTGGNYIIQVLPPIPTNGLTLDDVPKLADDVRLQMMDTFKKISHEK